MIKTKEKILIITENNDEGNVKMFLSNLSDFEGLEEKINMYTHAKLKPGEKVRFHIHTNESEIYYVLSGKALYDDNGVKSEIEPGTVTYTPAGSGHGIENIGEEMLEFMALEIKK